MTDLTIRTINKKQSLTALQSISEKDKTTVKDCIDTYRNFVCALAKKFTDSDEEAEAAAQEMFIDIGRYAKSGNNVQSAESLLAALIAQRRLIKHLE